MIGRTGEVAALSSYLAGVDAGVGGVVVISGEPGIGKSELAEHLAAVAVERGFLVGRGRCRETAGAPPFWPWRQVVRSLSGASWQALGEAGGSRFALFERVAGVLRDASSVAPVLAVLDDVHAADPASLQLLAFLGAQLFPARVGLVVTVRDLEGPGDLADVLTGLTASREGMRLDLGPMSLAEVEAWATRENVRGLDAGDVLSRTGGNPLFIREVLRLASFDPKAVPTAVRDVIRSRVARLTAASQEVLGAAAVLGRDFAAPTVAAMLGAGPDAIEEHLQAAMAARLIVDSGDGVRGRYRFAHVLTQQVVESDLDSGEQMRWHARAFAVLPYTDLAEPTDLAVHAVAAGSHLEAAQVLDATHRAAADANARLAWESAAHWWQASLAAAVRSGVEAEAIDDLRLALGTAQLRSGRVAEARDTFGAVAASRLAARDAGMAARAALAVGETVAEISPDGELLTLLDRVLELPGHVCEDRARLLARKAIATYWAADGPGRSRRLSEEAVEVARRCRQPGALGAAFVARVFTLRGPDDLDQRLSVGADALAVAHSAGDASLRFRAHQWLIPDRFQSGDLAGVQEALLAAEGLATQTREPLQRWWLLVWRCLLAGFYGDDDVIALAAEGRRLGRLLGQPAADTYALAAQFPLARRNGRVDELERPLDGLIARFPGLVSLQCNRVLLLADTGRVDQARRVFDRLVAPDLALLPRDALFLASVAILVETCVVLNDPDRARPLLDLLEPYADRNLIQGVPVGWGAAAWYLARGHHLCGDAPVARRHADRAQELHARWGTRAWDHPLRGRGGEGSPPLLSPRERDVLERLAAGRTNKEIAAALHLSVHTVERHVANIFLKLGTRTRAETTAWAHRHGMTRES